MAENNPQWSCFPIVSNLDTRNFKSFYSFSKKQTLEIIRDYLNRKLKRNYQNVNVVKIFLTFPVTCQIFLQEKTEQWIYLNKSQIFLLFSLKVIRSELPTNNKFGYDILWNEYIFLTWSYRLIAINKKGKIV